MVLIIGAGLPRTGTLSLATALDRLGFGPCHHMFALMRHPGRARLWLEALHGRADWAAALAGYRSAVDWPAAFFYAELAAAYPEAKVILSVRDPDRWYDSSRRMLASDAFRSMTSGRLARLVPVARTMNELMSTISARTFDIDVATAYAGTVDRARAVAAFERHNRRVRETVPADRLLTFDVRDGWPPLCAFLGVPVPDEPFPWHNDAADLARRLPRRTAQLYARGLLRPAVLGAVAVALTGAALIRRARNRRARKGE